MVERWVKGITPHKDLRLQYGEIVASEQNVNLNSIKLANSGFIDK